MNRKTQAFLTGYSAGTSILLLPIPPAFDDSRLKPFIDGLRDLGVSDTTLDGLEKVREVIIMSLPNSSEARSAIDSFESIIRGLDEEVATLLTEEEISWFRIGRSLGSSDSIVGFADLASSRGEPSRTMRDRAFRIAEARIVESGDVVPDRIRERLAAHLELLNKRVGKKQIIESSHELQTLICGFLETGNPNLQIQKTANLGEGCAPAFIVVVLLLLLAVCALFPW